MDSKVSTSTSKKASRPPEGQLRDEQLVQIAAELFARKGYAGTSLRDIAEAAGITKAALYYWFPEKEQLFERVVASRLAALVDRVTQAAAQGSDPVDRIRRIMRACAEHMDRDRAGWMASSDTFWSNFNQAQRDAVVPLRDRFERTLRECVREAIETGQLRPADPAIATRLMLSGLNMLPRWHKPGGRLTAVQVVEQYLDIVLAGLLPR